MAPQPGVAPAKPGIIDALLAGPPVCRELIIFQKAVASFFSRGKSTEVTLAAETPTADHLKTRGNAFLAEGRLAEAVACYRQAASAAPRDAALHVNLGYGLMELGQLPEAVESLSCALALDSRSVDAHFLKGQALVRHGLAAEAVPCFEAALALKPDFDFAWFELARAQQDMAQAEAALDSYARVLMLNPAFTEAANRKLAILLQMAQWQAALDFINTQAHQGPPSAFAIQRACALNGLKQHDEALALLEEVLRANPGELQALDGKATILVSLARWEDALAVYQDMVTMAPGFPSALVNAAAMCDKLGRFEEGLALFERAAQASPEDLAIQVNMAYPLLQLGRSGDAVQVCAHALQRHPENADLHWYKAFAHLLRAEFAQGWEEHEWRWSTVLEGSAAVRRNTLKPLWLGQPVEGKTVLLYAEQGLGDSLQMLRYVPLLAARGARVLLQVQAPLVPLCSAFSTCCTLVGPGHPAADYDYQCPLLSLPLAFRTDLTSIPSGQPYLFSDASLRDQWRARLGPRRGPRLGLVWTGNPGHHNDSKRSIPLAGLLTAVPDSFQVVSLQKDVRETDREALEKSGIFHAGPLLTSFAETAALTDLMDVVISVDTSVAHLAGALGKPLWVPLPFLPDWRWLEHRDDSPWYPTARLFRQGADREWRPVFDRLRAGLQQYEKA